jgi:hypothetical protein
MRLKKLSKFEFICFHLDCFKVYSQKVGVEIRQVQAICRWLSHPKVALAHLTSKLRKYIMNQTVVVVVKACWWINPRVGLWHGRLEVK